MRSERSFRRHGAAALVAILGVMLLVGPVARPASAAAGAPSADTTLSSLLNGLRTTLGLGSLTPDSGLSSIARSWAMKMADAGVMSHNPSLNSQAQGWNKIGENVAHGSVASQIFADLVASPVHMRNMSDPEFTRIGVGTAVDGNGHLWTSHVFIRPAGARATTPGTPAPVSTAGTPAAKTATTPKPNSAASVPPTPAPTPASAIPATTAPPVSTPASTLRQGPAGPVGPAASPGAASSPDGLELAQVKGASATRDQGPSVALLAGAGLLVLLVLGGAGILLVRRPGA